MKLFRTMTIPAAPAAPREALTADPDVLSTIWTVWLTAQPLLDQQVLAKHYRTGMDAPLAAALAADPVRKLLRLRADPAMAPEVQALADGLLAGATLGEVPAKLGWVAESSELERTLTTAAVREAIAYRMTRAGAEAVAFVIAFLVGTEWGAADAAPRRRAVARGVIFVALRDLGLPIPTWEARLIELEHGASDVAEAVIVAA